MPRAFGDDERVAAEDDRDVMMPTGEPSAFVVIEAEFTPCRQVVRRNPPRDSMRSASCLTLTLSLRRHPRLS